MSTLNPSETPPDDIDEELELPLWRDGFREVEARTVEPGDIVAYVRTMFGFPMSSDIHRSLVDTVEYDEEMGEVNIHHGGGHTECDELTPVWVLRKTAGEAHEGLCDRPQDSRFFAGARVCDACGWARRHHRKAAD